MGERFLLKPLLQRQDVGDLASDIVARYLLVERRASNKPVPLRWAGSPANAGLQNPASRTSMKTSMPSITRMKPSYCG